MRNLIATLLICIAVPAQASDTLVISERDSFLKILAGRALRLGMFDLSIQVRADGTLAGSAMGWQVTGDWAWKDGLFCRKMDWSGYPIEYDCQLVEKRGEKLRFTSQAGRGRHADFRLQ